MVQVIVFDSKTKKASVYSKIEKPVSKVILVSVGNDNFPATAEDIKSVTQMVDAVLRAGKSTSDVGVMIGNHTVKVSEIYVAE